MEQKEAHARRQLRREFERLAHFGTWERVIATGEVDWSPGTSRVLGLPPGQPPTREAFLAMLHPDDLPRYMSAIHRLEQHSEPFTLDLRINRPDGQTRMLRALGFREENAGGNGPRLIGAIQDITRARQLETDRAQLLEKILRTTDDERRRLAGRVHDDVIPELAVTLRRVEAQTNALDQELVDALRAPILATIDRLREIIADLDPPDVTAAQLHEALEQYVDRFMPAETDAEIRVGDVSTASKATLATALRIVREAISNAARHATASLITIDVDEGGNELVATVRDDGVGFAPDATGSRPAGHIGIRLMRQRTEDLGGEITLNSAPGDGTIVSFRLPLDPVTDRPSSTGRPDAAPDPSSH